MPQDQGGSTPLTPVNCDIDFDTSNLVGKTAIVTGGANGIGEAYVRALVGAGANVCIGDVATDSGEKLASELPRTKFVHCDVTNWDSQVHLFSTALSISPSSKIHYVIANAGIAIADEVFAFTPSESEESNIPKKPSLKTIELNLHGTLYTTKLAIHHFILQNGTSPSPTTTQEDTSIILIGSGAAFLDVPRSPLYGATKWANRGIMHSLRRTAHYHGSRINMIYPWYVRTNILSPEVFDHVQRQGIEFARLEDAGRCCLRLLGDKGINGRALFLAPRKWAKGGFLDLDLDEVDGELLGEIQEEQIRPKPVEKGLFP